MDKRLWSFLDVANMNLLYKYADVLSGNQCYLVLKPSIKGKKDQSDKENKKEDAIKLYIQNMTNGKSNASRITPEQREAVYYLIWFIYYYVLECKNLEDALLQDHIKVLKEWGLYKFIFNKYIYLGGDACFLPLNREKDIEIILEILYNRYSVIEQFECYLRHYGDKNDKRSEICRQAIELYSNIRGKRFYDNNTEENS